MREALFQNLITLIINQLCLYSDIPYESAKSMKLINQNPFFVIVLEQSCDILLCTFQISQLVKKKH